MGAFDNIVRLYNFIRPVLDVLVMTFILYKAYQLIIKTNAVQIIKAAVIVALAYAAALLLNLEMLRWLLGIIAPALVVCFAIVFQPEIRKIFLKLGQSEWFTFGNRSRHTYVDSVIIAASALPSATSLGISAWTSSAWERLCSGI